MVAYQLVKFSNPRFDIRHKCRWNICNSLRWIYH